MNGDRYTVLVVDDVEDEIVMLQDILGGEYDVRTCTSGEAALKASRSDNPPDLVLLDIIMPVMDGYETCRKLKEDPLTSNIPVIFLTAKTGPVNEKFGLDIGAEDYITKPPSAPIVLARIKTHLHLKEARDFFRDKSEFLEAEVQRRTREINFVQDVTILALASLAETRDSETGNHIRRTQHYIRLLATKLRDHPRFKDQLNDDMIEALYKSAPLHDIGKVGIPDSILKKPGKLDPDEFEIMKTHTTIGGNAIRQAETSLGSRNTFLSLAREIALSHHEKWNGSGYPNALAGENIPLSGRLMAIPDVYDALISRRVYKPPFSHEESVRIITEGAGLHFDPDITVAFLELADRFREVASVFRDSPE